MSEDIEQKIRKDIAQITDYNPKWKETIWKNIQQEIQLEEGENHMKFRHKRRMRIILVAALCGLLMGGTVLAKPILDELIPYFQSQKVKKVHDYSKDQFVTEQVGLYQSTLGYMTYYDPNYFEVTQEDGVDYFRAINDLETYVSVTLEREKDFETVLLEQTGKSIEDISPFLLDENAVEVEYKEHPENPGWQTVTMIAEGAELGTFVIKAHHTLEHTALTRMCHNIANEFIPLYEKNRERVVNGKPKFYFEYDQEKYELVQYASDNHRVYLQKNGVDRPDYSSDVLLTYTHYLDRSPEERALLKFDIAMENRRVAQELMEEVKADGKDISDWSLMTLAEQPNDLNVQAKKLVEIKDTTGEIESITYFIEDGQGGCYEVYIYLPHHEDLEAILRSIKIQEPSFPDMDYRIIVDESLG